VRAHLANVEFTADDDERIRFEAYAASQILRVLDANA
jgi:hypothetical protein